MDLVNLLQWPAMLMTVLATWLTASQRAPKRQQGFWWSFAGNLLWIAWAWPNHAYALIVLQLALMILNVRGTRKNQKG